MEYVDQSELVISVDKWNGSGYAVFWNGKPVKRFFGADAECRAQGCAMAMLDERPLRPALER